MFNMLGKKQRTKKMVNSGVAKNSVATSDICSNAKNENECLSNPRYLTLCNNTKLDNSRKVVNDFCLNGNSIRQKDLVRKFSIKSILKRIATFFFRLMWITVQIASQIFKYLHFSRNQTMELSSVPTNSHNVMKHELKNMIISGRATQLNQSFSITDVNQCDEVIQTPLSSRRYHLKKRKHKPLENYKVQNIRFESISSEKNSDKITNAVETNTGNKKKSHDNSTETTESSGEVEENDRSITLERVSNLEFDKDICSAFQPITSTPTKCTSKGKRRKQFSPTNDEIKKPRNTDLSKSNKNLNMSQDSDANPTLNKNMKESKCNFPSYASKSIDCKYPVSFETKDQNTVSDNPMPNFTLNEVSLSKLKESECPLPYRSCSAPSKKEGWVNRRPAATTISLGDFITPTSVTFGSKRKKTPPVGKILPEVKEPENRGMKYGPIGSRRHINAFSERDQEELARCNQWSTSVYYTKELLNHPAFSEMFYVDPRFQHQNFFDPAPSFVSPTYAMPPYYGTTLYQQNQHTPFDNYRSHSTFYSPNLALMHSNRYGYSYKGANSGGIRGYRWRPKCLEVKFNTQTIFVEINI